MEFFGDDPSNGDPARPLLLLLHGFGSDERDLPAIAEHLGLAPHQCLPLPQVLRERPTAFPTGVVLAGFATPFDEAGDAELAVIRPPVFFGWGTADPIIPESAFLATSAWLDIHSTPTEHRYPGLGHSINGDMLADIVAFLAEAVPER